MLTLAPTVLASTTGDSPRTVTSSERLLTLIEMSIVAVWPWRTTTPSRTTV